MSVADRMRKYRARKALRGAIARALANGFTLWTIHEVLDEHQPDAAVRERLRTFWERERRGLPHPTLRERGVTPSGVTGWGP